MIKLKIDAPENAVERLNLTIESNRLSHCILLTGATADIRKKAALQIASAFVCENQKTKPCGKCVSCKKIKNNAHPDMKLITVPDGKKFIPIQSIKEDIIQNSATVPTESQYNIFIIHEASDLREEAANALLKTIEEPPEFTRFIITAGSRAAVLPTVLSRSEEFMLGEERESITGQTAKKVDEIVLEIGRGLIRKNEKALMLATAPMTKNRELVGRVCEKMKMVMRDALTYNETPALTELDAMAKTFADTFDKNTLMKINDCLSDLLDDIEISGNENLLLCLFSRGLMKAVTEK